MFDGCEATSRCPATVEPSKVGLVDVVVPTFDARELVTECVERVQRDPAVSSITVVDDASGDGTADAVRARFDRSRVGVVVLDRHRGLSHALNAGSKGGDAEYVLFLNNDVMPVVGAVTRLVEALQADRDAVVAGGRLVDPRSHRTQSEYAPRELPGTRALLTRVCGLERRWERNPWTGAYLRTPLPESGVWRTDRQLAGSALLVRRTSFEAIGGWDERYWFWYEDVDLAARLRGVGGAVYVPEAVFEHLGGASSGGWQPWEEHLRRYHGTMVYAQEHLPRSGRRLIGAALTGATAVRLARSRGDDRARVAYRAQLRSAVALWRRRPLPETDFDADRPPQVRSPARPPAPARPAESPGFPGGDQAPPRRL